jgi:hypothetical protein
MNGNLEALRSLLADISELGAVAEDQGISPIPSFDPLVERARSLGLDVPEPTTLDDLRAAVEAACKDLDVDGGQANTGPVASGPILGNEWGIPGAGP